MALVSFTLSLAENMMLRNYLPFNYRNEVTKAEKKKGNRVRTKSFNCLKHVSIS